MRRNVCTWAALAALALGCLIISGCGEARSPYAGTYRSVEPYAGKGHVTLVFKDTGEASWTLGEGGQTLKFKWRVQDDRIWVYTKEGGILIITPSKDGKQLSVDMTGEWHHGCPPDKCITFKRVKGEM